MWHEWKPMRLLYICGNDLLRQNYCPWIVPSLKLTQWYVTHQNSMMGTVVCMMRAYAINRIWMTILFENHWRISYKHFSVILPFSFNALLPMVINININTNEYKYIKYICVCVCVYICVSHRFFRYWYCDVIHKTKREQRWISESQFRNKASPHYTRIYMSLVFSAPLDLLKMKQWQQQQQQR